MIKKIGLLFLLLLLTACSQETDNIGNTVLIKDFAFTPNEITISVGDSITWINKDQVQHQVVSDKFSSELLGKDESYIYTFTTAGRYDYICGPHPSMTGTIIVE